MIDRIFQIAPAGGLLAVDGWLRELFFHRTEESTVAGASEHLYMVIFYVSTFFFVLLMGLTVLFTLRYRRRPGVAPERSAAHNTALELTWTIVPLIILVYFFFKGFWGYMDHVVAPAESTELVVSARKWSWDVMYPNGARSPETVRVGAVDVPVIVVPAGRPVRMRMSSQDVIHSFWVPDYRVKFDVFPNRYTAIWFEPTWTDDPTPGANDHWVFCAEYCGDLHAEMAAIIRVVPEDEYRATVADWAVPKGTPEEIGRQLRIIRGCNSCHSVDGTPLVGPTWQNLFGYERTLANGQTVVADENYLRESILVPQAKIVQGFPGSMPPYQGQLSDLELEALITYIRSLSDRKPAVDLPPADGEGQDAAAPEADGAAEEGAGAAGED